MSALDALTAVPSLIGMAMGPIIELSSTCDKILDEYAQEGALKNLDRFGQTSYVQGSIQRDSLVAQAEVNPLSCNHGHRSALLCHGLGGRQ